MNIKLMDKYIEYCRELDRQPSFKGMMFFKKAFR